MYVENLPTEYQPKDLTTVPRALPAKRMRWNRFFDLADKLESIKAAKERLGISGSVISRWLLHPEFQARYDRVVQWRCMALDDRSYTQGLNLRHGHEDRKLWLKAHHPVYKENSSPQVAVQINISSEALARSRAIHAQIVDTTSSTPETNASTGKLTCHPNSVTKTL